MAEDGSIIISINKNEDAHLKLICDEIFVSNNFISNVAVVNNLKGRRDDKFIATAQVLIPEGYVNEYK